MEYRIDNSPFFIYLPEDELLAGSTALIAAALHDSNVIDADIKDHFIISSEDRFREEDPYTAEFTFVGSVRIISNRSRFIVDLNRPREKAVYRGPEDAWGLDLYKNPIPDDILERALHYYDSFYSEVYTLFTGLIRQWGKIFIYDFHSYNYRRNGPNAPELPKELNPDINIGTGNINRDYWSRLIDRFILDLKSFDYNGRNLDVRENIRFKGGYFSQWVAQNFPLTACVLAIEVKKFFMDEWTGLPYLDDIAMLKKAFFATRIGVMEELKNSGIAA